MKSIFYLSLTVSTLLVISSKKLHIPVTCQKISPCVCKDETGKYVDLRPLAKKDGTPKFLDHHTAGTDSNLYSFNPCYGFNEGKKNSSCQNVAACQANKDRTQFIGIGVQSTAQFGHGDNGNLSLTFGSSLDRYRITTVVVLYCAEDVEDGYFRVIGDIGNHNYWLQLRSKHCCPKNESEIAHLDELLGINGSGPVTYLPRSTNHTVTMITQPDKLTSSDVIIVVLFCTLFVAILILAGLAGAVLYYRTRHPMFGRNVYYQPVVNDDEDNIVHFINTGMEKGDMLRNDVYGQTT
ncbi:uncharacterized protein LOC132550669 [Ylistrum balloti]|uniref:uncharacterized protein LOC132550669 n=1 Tax=Ylistrum balloti TaxID=509963 RepID=UPI002905B44F|nr:uncharacterized protein LOC132550669 [Ylistrum balloti]